MFHATDFKFCFQHLFVHISAVGSPNRLSWITNQWSPISPQFTYYLSHIIFESVMRDKWPLDSMSEINCHGEITPRPRIEPASTGLQIRCITYRANNYGKSRSPESNQTKINKRKLQSRLLSLSTRDNEMCNISHVPLHQLERYSILNTKYIGDGRQLLIPILLKYDINKITSASGICFIKEV